MKPAHPESRNASGDNAMTEIALALAMAFFSIMVLSMVSMGVATAPQPQLDGKALVHLTESKPGSPTATNTGAQQAPAKDTLFFFDGKRFFDTRLSPVNPASLHNSGPIYLAVTPDLSITDTLAAKAQFKGDNVVVTTMDQAWINALKGE